MDAQTTVNKLADHLLGKDWYIADSVGGNQANDIIFEEIAGRYKAVDESPADRWRRKHKRCLWCKYCKFEVYCGSYSCTVKVKPVNPDMPKPFCSVFQLETSAK